MKNIEYNLCPNSNTKPRPAFTSREEYEKFRRDFAESVKPELDRYRLARIYSEEDARHHFVS